MIETPNALLTQSERREEQLTRMGERIFSAAQSRAVYSDPVTTGAYTIITASEINAGGGFGAGFGLGPVMFPRQRQETSQAAQDQATNSGGSGMGGGGGSSGRPVAVIIIGADGVRVRPVVDVTKIALAGVTLLGTMVMLLRTMRRARRG
ncbi:MAG TPA: hypothetical protein VKQ36_02280 [Ktedonobacterales bacterium]|nr:hypothetical protein [Ktedonobacterales bacterium]